MGNMSYCRFQNTLTDLVDCSYHMDDELGEEERKARDKLLMLCHEICQDQEGNLEFLQMLEEEGG